jgi:hypothetical protein
MSHQLGARTSPASADVHLGLFRIPQRESGKKPRRFTSPRLRGEVEVCVKREFRVRGTGLSIGVVGVERAAHPQPSARQERGEGEEAAAHASGRRSRRAVLPFPLLRNRWTISSLSQGSSNDLTVETQERHENVRPPR